MAFNPGTVCDYTIRQLKTWKTSFGDGVSSLILVYNASGDPLVFDCLQSFHGRRYDSAPAPTILNGEWMGFLHVKTSGVGSSGALVCFL
jgi:hypothetical protein